MKNILALVCLLLLSTTALSQTRSRTTRRGTQAAKTAAQPDNSAQAKTAAATKVADQIKNLTRFLYILGGVARGIEDVDLAAKNNKAY